MYNPLLFEDRSGAGRKLAAELKGFSLEKPVVLAIPAGGMPVGMEIAKALHCGLDLIIVCKVQFPWTTEAGFGAVAADGTSYIGPGARKLSPMEVELQKRKAIEQVKHREEEFLGDRKRVEVKGRAVVLVDDGLATGSTMFAAVESVGKGSPARVIVAVPTASGGAVELLRERADEVIALYTHPRGLPFAVASSYRRWHDLTDEEVRNHLRATRE